MAPAAEPMLNGPEVDIPVGTPWWFEVARCPATGGRLRVIDGLLEAPEGERSYPIIDGVPILIAAERSLFDPDSYASAGGGQTGRVAERVRRRAARLSRALLHMPPTISRSVGTRENYSELARLLIERSTSGERRVLIIGAGVAGFGTEALTESPGLRLLETDVVLGPTIDVVCDGHDLPFADASFDAAVCQAVLEHVIDPYRVADEVRRVLRPGGLVYSEVPFMQQVHEGAFDFTRFTHLGHRRLWRYFDELSSGAQGGPGMALAWSIRYFLQALLGKNRLARAVITRATSWGFFWLKYFDSRLVAAPGGIDAASGTFFMGRKRTSPLPDRHIVAEYRGVGPRAKPLISPS